MNNGISVRGLGDGGVDLQPGGRCLWYNRGVSRVSIPLGKRRGLFSRAFASHSTGIHLRPPFRPSPTPPSLLLSKNRLPVSLFRPS
jgi:hypothetical protein